MALRMRRRRKSELAHEAAEHVQHAVRAGQDLARAGLERAADATAAATAAVEGVSQAATASKSRRLGRTGVVMLGLFLVVAAAAAFYAWWTRRRQDEEFARLRRAPAPPDASPSAPRPPAAPTATLEDAPSEPVAPAAPTTPMSTTPHEAPEAPEPVVAQPWTPSVTAPVAAPASAVEASTDRETQVERQRAAWNSAQREVPLFVLPLRPTVPFRGAATPSAERARLPGSSPSFRG